jgi:hypothetical protein
MVLVALPIITGDIGLTEETDYDWVIATEDASIRLDALASAYRQVDWPGRDRRSLAEQNIQGRAGQSRKFSSFSNYNRVEFM